MNHPISEVTCRYLNRYEHLLKEFTAAMEGAELTDSISHNFIAQMIPHHRAAVEMSQNVLKYIQSPAMRSMAKDLIAGETQSISDMEAVLAGCAQVVNSSDELAAYQARATEIMDNMFQEMRHALKTNRIAEDFMLEMIPHHEGAIEMSQNAQQYPVCNQLKPILDSIISSQQRSVQEMKALLQIDP